MKVLLYKIRSIRDSTVPQPVYELMDKSGDVNVEKNPAYSVAGVQESSVDHQYESIPVNNRFNKTKK